MGTKSASGRRRSVAGTALFGAAFALSGCTGSADASQSELASLRAEVQSLSTTVSALSAASEGGKVAYLKPAEPEFQRIHTDMGTLAVSIDNITEYANGSKVTLSIGNPTGANLLDLSARVEWGRVDGSGAPTGTPLSKDFKLDGPAPAASWHRVTLALPDVPPKELGFIRVSNLEYQRISLRTN